MINLYLINFIDLEGNTPLHIVCSSVNVVALAFFFDYFKEKQSEYFIQ